MKLGKDHGYCLCYVLEVLGALKVDHAFIKEASAADGGSLHVFSLPFLVSH